VDGQSVATVAWFLAFVRTLIYETVGVCGLSPRHKLGL
jgi:hypothetical protein